MEPSDTSRRGVIRWIRILAVTLLAILLAGFPLGYIVKQYAESHSEEWICRKISIGSVFINPLTTSVTVTDFKMYEQNSDSVFASFDEFHLNAAGYKLLFKTVDLEAVALEGPRVNINMSGEKMNIDDLLACFSSTDTTAIDSTATQGSFDWEIRGENIFMTEGDVRVFLADYQAGLGLTKIELVCPSFSSRQPRIDGSLNFLMASGGSIKNDFHVFTDSMRYSVVIAGDSVDVGFILPFVDKFMYVTGVKGMVDTRLTVGGKFDAAISEAVGFIRLTDFEMLDSAQKRSIAADRFEIGVDTVSAIKGSYALRRVLLDSPYFSFGITKEGNTLMRREEVPVEVDSVSEEPEDSGYTGFFQLINQYLIDLGKEYAINYYAIDPLQLRGGEIVFDDYTLHDRMHFLLEDLTFNASHLHSDQDSIKIDMNTRLNRSGRLKAELTVMPRDTGDLVLNYTIDSLKVSDFSPYSEYYVAYPFWDGVVYFDSHSTILSNMVDSRNHMLIKNLTVGDKVVNSTAYKLPIKLAVSLLKDVHGNIDLKVPVKGNVNDPDFSFFPIVVKIFKDLIVKAAAAPYKLLARTFDADEEDIRNVHYDYLQEDIRKRQRKSLNLLARILNQKKELRARLVHLNNPDWEKAQYAVYHQKLEFYTEKNGKSVMTFDDSVAADQISRLDSAFIGYLKKKSGKQVVEDVESTSISLIGAEKLLGMMNEVNARRVLNLTEYLKAKVDNPGSFRVEEASAKDKNVFKERPRFNILIEAPDNVKGQ